MTSPPHDPEAAAAAYLAADFSPDGRGEFEAHLLECEACWGEVRSARDGRALAEDLRESAPQAAREFLRTLGSDTGGAGGDATGVAVSRSAGTGQGQRRSWLSIAAAVIAGAALTGGLLLGPLSEGSQDGRAQLAAAAALYTDDALAVVRTGTPPVVRLGALGWRGTSTASLAGQPATVHRYADAGGHRVLLVSSLREFPRPKDAQTVLGSSWSARIDGTAIFCVDHGGLSWLVIGASRDLAIEAGRQAGLA